MASNMIDFQKLKDKLLSPKGSKILLVAGLAGILLIAVSSFIPSSSSAAANTASASSASVSTDEYAAKLEEQLKEIVTSISGVGKATVMITFSESTQTVYEQDEKTSADKSAQTESGGNTAENNSVEQDTVVLNTDNGDEALVKTQIMPTVKGVVIVCDGGDDAVVQQNVIKAVSTALDLSTNHICVTKRTSD